MATRARDVAELEITKRKSDLRAKFYELATTFALGLVVTLQTENGGMPAEMKLDRKELAAKAAYDALHSCGDILVAPLTLNSKEALLSSFCLLLSFANADTESKMSDQDRASITPIAASLSTWLPTITVQVWHLDV